MIVNFQELVSEPITKDGRLTRLDQFFEDRPRTDRATAEISDDLCFPGKDQIRCVCGNA